MPTSSAIFQASRRIRPVTFSSLTSKFLHPCAITTSCPSTPRIIPRHFSQTIGSTNAHHFNASSKNNDSSLLSMAAYAAALAALSSTDALSASVDDSHHESHVTTTRCESTPPSLSNKSIVAPADETEDSSNGDDNNNNNRIIHIRDGMDAGSETPRPHSLLASDESAAEDDDDDPANDEETTCSICLINRQGPCRKYWLKFERCMKDHSEEKERRETEQRTQKEEEEEKKRERERSEGMDGDNVNDITTMEEEWDRFMEKSVMPGEEEEEEDEEQEDEEQEDEEEDDEEDDDKDNTKEEQNNHDNSVEEDNNQNNHEPSLGERCDKFMIPWISCIQEHRNVYSLISNAFYQKDYVDPLEESVPNFKRRPFTKIDATIGEKEGYVVKFMGAEVDLGNWREHVEAQAEEDFSLEEEEDQREMTRKKVDEPHLINAYAKFKLTEPDTGNPIEVAYIKDQKGRLLGFDSFSKREGAAENNDDEDMMHSDTEKIHDGSTMEHSNIHDGECTFHIEPGETTSVAAYAIYKSKKLDDKGEEHREYVLYYTPHIPLPGNQSDK